MDVNRLSVDGKQWQCIRAKSTEPVTREEVKLLDRCYSDKAPMTSQPAGKGTCLAFAVSHKNRWERKAEP